jgi:ribosomal protein L31E
MRWSFEVEFEGSHVAYTIPMSNKEEALASIDRSGEQIEAFESTVSQHFRHGHVWFRESVEIERGIREALRRMKMGVKGRR